MGPSEASRTLGVSEGTILRWRKGDIRLPLRNPAKNNLFEAVRRATADPRVRERDASDRDETRPGSEGIDLVRTLIASEDARAFLIALGARRACNALLEAARIRGWSPDTVSEAIDAANEFFDREGARGGADPAP
ncbi:MAG: hypothetical protein MJB57_09450 [Gemmatimonadetes bacterium]|nr:hypothetical protein [Gemmatimonadota bacterium]